MSKDSIADWAATGIAFAAATSAIVQYMINSRRGRAIKAADEIDSLNNDEAARAILRLLDWESAHISVRDETGAAQQLFVSSQKFLLAARDHSKPRNSVANYNKALDDHKASEYTFAIEEERIRDMLDRFLGRLERIESLITNGVIKPRDFQHYFSYWLNLLDEKSTVTTLSKEKRAAFWNYVRVYGFTGVVHLFARFSPP